MKKYIFHIDRHQADWIFSPIRVKADLVEILVRVMKLMITPVEVPEADRVGQVTLIVSKMSRLFFSTDKKIFSLAFPFIALESDGMLSFHSHSHPGVDSRVTSEILALLKSPNFLTTSDVLGFADPICSACDFDVNVWSLLRDLLLGEGGYIRYDDDVERVNGHLHPRHHLDLFYSQGATFKAGLSGSIGFDHLADILNIETNCHYLHVVP